MDLDEMEGIIYISQKIPHQIIIRVELLQEISVDMPEVRDCIVFLDDKYQTHCVYANVEKHCIKRLKWDEKKDGQFDYCMRNPPMEIVHGNVLILMISILK